jgi:flagellar biosynthetic protein FliQ
VQVEGGRLNEAQAVNILREAIVLILLLSAPALLVALVVGVVISIIQAATQVQEQTLTFVPKIIAVFIMLLVLAPWLLKMLVNFTENLYARIPTMIR